MIRIRTLSHDDFESLYAAFTAAFSDYVVPFALTREQLAEMMTRRGWVPEVSVGAFDDDGAMVAFTLNGVEGDRAYDTGTGVVPSHRRHGLGRELMERSFELLRERCREYVLEVIDKNTRAFELYRSGSRCREGCSAGGTSRRVAKSRSRKAVLTRLCDSMQTSSLPGRTPTARLRERNSRT